MYFGNAKILAAVRRCNRIMEEIYRFTDRLDPNAKWMTYEQAIQAVAEKLRAARNYDCCRYLSLLNRFVQAWNAWARLAGVKRREEPIALRSMPVVVRRGVRPILPQPVAYISKETRDSFRAEAPLYDTERYVPSQQQSCQRPHPRREAPYDVESTIQTIVATDPWWQPRPRRG